MKVIADPNWFTIVGLFYSFYGLGHLAGIATVRSAALNPMISQDEQAAKRSVRSAFSILLLALGFGQLLLGQIMTIPFGQYAVLMLLGLAFLGLTFALIADSWASSIATPSIATPSIVGQELEYRASGLTVRPLDVRRRVDLVHAAQ